MLKSEQPEPITISNMSQKKTLKRPESAAAKKQFKATETIGVRPKSSTLKRGQKAPVAKVPKKATKPVNKAPSNSGGWNDSTATTSKYFDPLIDPKERRKRDFVPSKYTL